MLGKTHRAGGAVAALGGYIILKDKGYLVQDITPVVQLAVMYPFAMWASIAPDLDHHADIIPAKDPISKGFNWVLHIFNEPAKKVDAAVGMFTRKKTMFQKMISALACKHRSWQTHSDLTIATMFYLYWRILRLPPTVENTVITLVMTGLILGFISHIVLDMMTTAGIPTVIGRTISKVLPFNIRNLRIVPKTSMFGTDTPYENYVRKLLTFISMVLLLYIVIDIFGYSYIIKDWLSRTF